MQKIVILLFFALSASVFGQDYLNKTEKYDVELFNYLDSLTVERKVPLEEYLKFSKPFSKWDIRPVQHEKIYALIRYVHQVKSPIFSGVVFLSGMN
jgi:hypothetical protein